MKLPMANDSICNKLMRKIYPKSLFPGVVNHDHPQAFIQFNIFNNMMPTLNKSFKIRLRNENMG